MAYLPAPDLPHARRQQEHQEAGRRHHRCAYHPADVLKKSQEVRVSCLAKVTPQDQVPLIEFLENDTHM